MNAKVVPIPKKLQEALGEEATREMADLINEVATTVSSTKVDRREYDAHAALIEEKFKYFEEKLAHHETRVESTIRGALIKGLAWMTALIYGLFGALWALASTLK